MRKIYLIYASIFLPVLFTSGQPIFSDFENIGVDEGLSQSSVFALYQDKEGFIWIGTGDGLNRYDGKQIKTYKAPVDLSTTSNSNLIRGKLAEDSNGNIWYTTENGIYILDKSTDAIQKKYSFIRNELSGSDFLLSFIDKNQTVWVRSDGNGIGAFKIKEEQFSVTPNPYQLNLNNIVPNNHFAFDENIWFVVQQNEGIYKFNTKNKTFTRYNKDQDLRFLKVQKNKFYYVSSKGVSYYDSALRSTKFLKLDSLDPTSIKDLIEDNYKRVWFSTWNQGLWYYDLAKEEAVQVKKANDLYNSYKGIQLTYLLIDKTDNLWIGTDGAGVDRLNLREPIFKKITKSDQRIFDNDLFVRGIIEKDSNQIWVLSLRNSINIFQNGKPIANSPLLQKINRASPDFIGLDKNGTTWIKSQSMILSIDAFNKETEHLNMFNPSWSNIILSKIEELQTGEIAFGTNSGIFLLNKNKGSKLIHVIQNRVTDFVETREGVIWTANKNYGLLKMVKDKDSKYIIEKSFFNGLDINAIHVDQKDFTCWWLASDKGMIRFNIKSSEFTLYSEKDGMNNSYVYGILEDLNDNLWCSTNGGLTRFNKTTHQFTNYTVLDGLQSNEFNTGAFHKGKSGRFYFGGVKGFNWFRPEDLDQKTIPPPTSITEIFVNDNRLFDSLLDKTNTITLPYFKNDLSIRFSLFEFSKPQSNKVKYQLLRWDNKPQITYSLFVTYNNLPPGDYVLVYSGSTSNNSWSPEKKLYLVIEPPFWNSWWFYTLVIISIASFIATITWFVSRQKYKMKILALEKINALEQERRRIGMEMHDDIGASLTQITLISEAAKRSFEKNDALEQIAQTCRKVVTSMSEIIWSLNSDNNTFEQFTAYLREQLHSLLEPSGIAYTILLPEKGECNLSKQTKRNIILLIKETVNNAIKHAKATSISITGKLVNSKFLIEITDNGIGFDFSKDHPGNGLKNMKARINAVGGQIQIKSDQVNGTAIYLEFNA